MFSLSPHQNALVLTAVSFSLNCCFASSLIPHIAPYFGTKTRYEEVNPRLLRDVLFVNRSILKAPTTERCSPVHLTAVIRHGSRYPTVKNIRRIQRLSELVRREASRGSERWQQDIQSWENWFTEDMDGQLVTKGRAELRDLASRLLTLFPSLLLEKNLNRISLRSSSKHRCVSSMEAFQEGLWRRPDIQHHHIIDDQLLRFFEHCRGFVEGVENNRTALQEVDKFKHGEEMEALRRKTARRLGLPHQRFTTDLLEAAFFICSYELSIKSIHSPWCFLFTEDDAKVLEYQMDLKQYWKRSHGHMISSLSSCPLFHHIFRTLDKAGRPRRSTEELPEPASILLGHGETLLPLLSLLGLHKDQTPPTASNYHAQHGRSFRTSRIVPYAANLLFVLYDCQRGPRLQLLLNEAPVRFPGLQEDAPLYRDVRATYRHLLDGCDVDRECEGRAAGRVPNTEL
ncbi:multiple inositol polyphosphate phosphatase 1b isoform X1 [Takifugu rubripes]|uniref:Multiple inositol polyphosphate phosphatase 1 n=1 Tax=Takifugu rubripes TaxID=31033 RepID=A0A674PDU8_TAKRU|nr:multiple inositol polyphosphate phosphatase 1-like isoform X1 [Takifugu rubripes]XP_056915467.1 multiple inositol polyphosphate phosphatase 1b isoform X1 [Takifugu flavidus]